MFHCVWYLPDSGYTQCTLPRIGVGPVRHEHCERALDTVSGALYRVHSTKIFCVIGFLL